MPVGFSWGTSKPPAGVPINRSHPLADQLLFAYTMSENSGSVLANAVGESGGAFMTGAATTLKWRAGPLGAAIDGNAGTIQYAPASAPPGLNPTRFTFACYAQATTLGTSKKLPGFTTSAQLQLGSSDSSLMRFIVKNTGNSQFTASSATGAVVANQWAWWFGTFDGTTVTLWKNGISQGTATLTGSVNVSNTAFTLTTSGNPWVGPIGPVYVWGRCLSTDDLARVMAEPYGMFAPPVWRRYFVPSAGLIFSRTRSIFGTRTGSRQLAA